MIHGRYRRKDSDFLTFKQIQNLRGVKCANEDRRAAEDDLRQGVDEKSACVEHGEDVEIDIVMCHIVDDGIERVPSDHAVRHFRSFGQTCRSASEYQGGGILCFETGTGHGGVRGGLKSRLERH